jgi:hypothetical protein
MELDEQEQEEQEYNSLNEDRPQTFADLDNPRPNNSKSASKLERDKLPTPSELRE